MNTQGLAWDRTDHNFSKLQELLKMARLHHWDVTMLSELHENEEMAAYIIEFVFLSAGRTGSLLSFAARRAWEQAGRKSWITSPRCMAIALQSKETLWCLVAVYTPVSSEQADRLTFFDDARTISEQLPSDAWRVWAGDWNSHVGNDYLGTGEVHGGRGLHTPTTSAGRQQRSWASSLNLCRADSFLPMRHRATWQLVR